MKAYRLLLYTKRQSTLFRMEDSYNLTFSLGEILMLGETTGSTCNGLSGFIRAAISILS